VNMCDLPLITADEARASDRVAMDAGTSAATLMARAAGHLARTVLASTRGAHGLRVAIVVGNGDNGGDGWAAAPLLAARGALVRVIVAEGAGQPASLAARAARRAWLDRGGSCDGARDHSDHSDAAVGRADVMGALVRTDGRARADVVVDCLLGTGTRGPLRDGVARASAAINAARSGGALVVACDVPSGVSADDGSVAQGAVVADVTVTFGALKRGLLLAPASAHVGALHLGRLGPTFTTPAATWRVLTATGARPPIEDAHGDKRRRGSVLIVAGRTGTSGAAALAGLGALASGAGLVTVAVPRSVRAEVAAHHPALMVVGLPEDADGGLHPDAVHALPLDGIDAVVAGPGLGIGPGVRAVVEELRARADHLVLDADALNVHRAESDRLADHNGTLVLTPHLRELDRIGGAGTYIARASEAPRLAAAWGAHLIVKGPGTLVAAPDGTVWVTPSGSPALGTAGTGDVLAGMLGATLARGAASGEDATDVARRLARTVWWHAAAGVVAGARSAGRTDALGVLAAVPHVLAHLAGLDVGRDVGRDPGRDPGPMGRCSIDALLAPAHAVGLAVRSDEEVAIWSR